MICLARQRFGIATAGVHGVVGQPHLNARRAELLNIADLFVNGDIGVLIGIDVRILFVIIRNWELGKRGIFQAKEQRPVDWFNGSAQIMTFYIR